MSDQVLVNYLRTKPVTSSLNNFKWVVCSYVCKQNGSHLVKYFLQDMEYKFTEFSF